MREPLFRKTFDAAVLLRDHPPRFRHSHKAALFEMAYPGGSGGAGTIEVTRWREERRETVALPAEISAIVSADFYTYARADETGQAVEWHVNFADPRLFTAYGSPLLAQDEMQVVEHPLLGSVREALLAGGMPAMTEDENGATPILLRNVERRLAIATGPDASAGRPGGIYGNRFAAALLEVVRRACRRIDPPDYSNIIAMAAPAGGRGDYTDKQIGNVYATAFTAFAAAVQESGASGDGAGQARPAVIHTGFWGCGAFGGNRRLMIALQALAARAANVSRLVLHAGDPAGVDEAKRGLDVADGIAFRCGQSCSLDKLIDRCVMMGFQWGESDGN